MVIVFFTTLQQSGVTILLVLMRHTQMLLVQEINSQLTAQAY